MKLETKTRHIIIRKGRPEDIDHAINEILELPDLISHRLTYLTDPVMFAAIEYTTETTIFETMKEEYEARGEVYYCDECPYLKPIEDRRHKYHECRCGTTSPSRKACKLFYDELAKGELEPEGGRL